MKRLDPILLMVILVPVLICGVTYFAKKKREIQSHNHANDLTLMAGRSTGTAYPISERDWSAINTVTDTVSHWWTTNCANAAVTNTVYPEDKPLPACLTISVTNHDIVNPGYGSVYLIRFTDAEWEFLTNHYPRYTNSIQTFKFYADLTNNPTKP